ncbi:MULTISPECIES: hypothetical protein [Pseudomonas]|nr:MULTISPECIES: hypothetical protein [Pseudomonas]KAF0867283.1 hypothetical protein PLD_02130 [Pseudomonas sp. LD120]MBP5105789.1 hypothetical protein [Pseudomonas protegens]MBP5133315.1 hypothetical protein [Pseudomonas protegens]MBP5150723.1 hypothetical protein [Pseudomonas protegens]
MKATNYHRFFLKKISSLLYNKTISSLIMVSDENGELIDNVSFFEVDYGGVVGFYINGANPLISTNLINEFDDFNLYSLYSVLSERRSGDFLPFKVEFIKVFFHSEYNEAFSIFLSSADFSSSILIVFSTDEIHAYINCGERDLVKMIKEHLTQFEDIDFFTCKIDIGDEEWFCV